MSVSFFSCTKEEIATKEETAAINLEKKRSEFEQILKKTGRDFIIETPNNKSLSVANPIVIDSKEELERFLASINFQKQSKQSKTTIGNNLVFDQYDAFYPLEHNYIHYENLVGISTYFNVDIFIRNHRTNGGKSYLSGYTLGISYTENYLSIYQNFSAIGQVNYFRFQGSGLLHYHIIIEGIGEFFAERVNFGGQRHGIL